MLFDELLQQAKTQAKLTIPATWTQGRTGFGGLSAAMIYSKMLTLVESDRSLRSFNLSFCGPLIAEQDFNIEVEELRSGKTISNIYARIIQNGKLCVSAQAVFAKVIDSNIAVNNFTCPDLASVEQGLKLEGGHFPEFVQHFDLSMVDGDLPFTQSRQPRIGGWMRFKQAPEKFQAQHLMALIDTWPPTTISCLAAPAPLSTVSWNLKLIQPLAQIAPTDYLGYQAEVDYSQDGIGYTRAHVWGPKGDLLAISEQTIIVYG